MENHISHRQRQHGHIFNIGQDRLGEYSKLWHVRVWLWAEVWYCTSVNSDLTSITRTQTQQSQTISFMQLTKLTNNSLVDRQSHVIDASVSTPQTVSCHIMFTSQSVGVSNQFDATDKIVSSNSQLSLLELMPKPKPSRPTAVSEQPLALASFFLTHSNQSDDLALFSNQLNGCSPEDEMWFEQKDFNSSLVSGWLDAQYNPS